MTKYIKLPVIILSLTGFLLSLQLGFTAYIDSTYLSHLLSNYTNSPDRSVGYIFAFTAAVSLLVFVYIPKLLRKFGNTKITIFSGLALSLALIILSIQPNIIIAIIAYLITTLAAILIFTANDLFLSSSAGEEETGFIRGVYFALISLGFMLSPAAAGYLVEAKGLSAAYLAGAICTIPIAFLVWFTFRKYKDENYEDVPILPNKTLRKSASDLMPVFWANFTLQAFYTIMTIYAPLYFIESIGLSYDKFGYILTIALATFVILPTPLGYIADKFLGEKEMMIIGILLMGGSLIAIPILAKHPQSLLVWGIVLFISRIGATMTETMTDTFFFKKIEHAHPALIAFYRRTKPLALLVIPAISAVLLSLRLVDIPELFMLAGAVMIISIIFPLQIIDTK